MLNNGLSAYEETGADYDNELDAEKIGLFACFEAYFRVLYIFYLLLICIFRNSERSRAENGVFDEENSLIKSARRKRIETNFKIFISWLAEFSKLIKMFVF